MYSVNNIKFIVYIVVSFSGGNVYVLVKRHLLIQKPSLRSTYISVSQPL